LGSGNFYKPDETGAEKSRYPAMEPGSGIKAWCPALLAVANGLFI
jgi:hypothetical protein